MIRSILFSFSGQILTFIAALIAVPLTVRVYGIASYGIIALVIAALGATSMLDFGLSRTTTKFVAEKLALQDSPGAVSAIWMSTILQTLVGVFAGGIAFTFRSFLAGKIGSGTLTQPDINTLITFLAAAMPLTLASGALRGALEGAQRFGLVSLVKTIQNCSLYLIPMAGGWLSLTVLQVAIFLCVSRFLVTAIYLAICTKLFHNFWTYNLFRKSEQLNFWQYTGWLAASNVVVAFLLNADRLFLAVWSGAEAVGTYAITMEVINGLSVITGCITGVLMPAFSKLNVQKESSGKIPPIFFRGVRWVTFLLLPVTTVLFLQSHFLLSLWQGPMVADNCSLPLKVALLALFTNALGWVPTALALGLGRADIVAKLQIAQIPLLLVLAWLLIPAYGATGAAVAFLIRVFIETTVMYFAAARKLLPQSFPAGTILRLDRIALLSGLALPLWVALRYFSNPWAVWTSLGAYATAYVVFWWLLAADQTEKEAIKGFAGIQKATASF
jgi:O-antigen/teichoic acid export membrane protein